MDQLPITQPVTPIGDQRSGTGRFARRLARRQAGLPEDEEESGQYPVQALPSAPGADPAQPLLEALDRLRVTNQVRPVDLEYARTLRAMKAYQDPTTAIYRAPADPPSAQPA
jgi:hypothetical protein